MATDVSQQLDPQTVLNDLDSRARKFDTPCGDGSMVWRSWGDGPPLVLAHGSHGSWAHWVRNIAALSVKRTVWAPDLPGWGESALPPRLDHESISEAIAVGVEQLIGRTPVDIVGFSFGGVASAHFAGYHPGLVRRLILVDTGGLDTPMGDIKLERVRGLDEAGRKLANRKNLLALMVLKDEAVDELALIIQARGASQARLDPIPFVLPDKLLHALPRIQAPLSAIWAEFDQPHPNPPAQKKVIRSIHPDARFITIPDSGHWVMYEQAALFNAVLVGLLDELPHA